MVNSEQSDSLIDSTMTPRHGSQRGNHRSSLVALAMVIGLLAFLVAEALPGGLSGVAAFSIAFGSAFVVVVILIVIAVLVDNRSRPRRAVASLEAAIAQAVEAEIQRLGQTPEGAAEHETSEAGEKTLAAEEHIQLVAGHGRVGSYDRELVALAATASPQHVVELTVRIIRVVGR